MKFQLAKSKLVKFKLAKLTSQAFQQKGCGKLTKPKVENLDNQNVKWKCERVKFKPSKRVPKCKKQTKFKYLNWQKFKAELDLNLGILSFSQVQNERAFDTGGKYLYTS